ncbi:bifunctional diguanylate cyclase/phosphodiesterase [Thiomicrorhabdus sp. Milos-T2]|uniref:sensor domain-containing protein n=1 Tax=Thiomicrorhabdus sp. Milos-T2 TaxID=90814 RepID=UPI0004947682|nr:bifunctional diguanylate cyclase/phosphodiesterase [Thiomicrorhabdus sp. Milos-T2]
MKRLKTYQISINLILFLMIFAITFASIFTYIPVYNYVVEQKKIKIQDEAELQAIVLKKLLTPSTETDSKWRQQQNAEAAINQIKSLWAQFNQNQPEHEYFLIHKNPITDKTEALFSSKTEKPDQQTLESIGHPLYMVMSGKAGIQNNSQSLEDVKLIAYTPVIPKEWGLVIKYNSQSLKPVLIETVSYTAFAALLITLISWLIFSLTIRKLNSKSLSSLERYQQLLANSQDWVWEIDKKGFIHYSSNQVLPILGYKPDDVLGKSLSTFFEPRNAETTGLVFQQKLMLGKTFTNLEVEFINNSGQEVYMLLSGHPILNKKNQITGYQGTARDVSDLKKRESKMLDLANHDSLTQLANRSYFLEQLRKHLKLQTPANSLKLSALLFIDLDGIKEINSLAGHEVGDQVLTIIAKRMQNNARKGDLVARFGGDEFVILVEQKNKLLPKELYIKMDSYLKRLLDAIHEPIHVQDHQIQISANIGIAFIPRDGKTTSEILNHSDKAMYQAKALGKNNYYFYNQDSQAAIDEKLKSSAELKQAIENNEFELYYQFQYEMYGEKIVGMEALLRWHHPVSHKILPATDFIKSAQNTKNIMAIDHWVINTVAEHIAKLNKLGIKAPPISVNLSTEKLEENTLAQMVEQTIKRNFISSGAIQIEITESSLIHDLEKSSNTLKQLRNLGIKVCIDDFGTGYSNLSYLQALPIQTIKIDKSLINKIATSHSDLQVCKTIIQLAKSLQLEVIAEGVQSEVQKDILLKAGCLIAQGYLYSHPEPLDKITTLLTDNPLAIKTN